MDIFKKEDSARNRVHSLKIKLLEDEISKYESEIDKLFKEEPNGIQKKLTKIWKWVNRESYCSSELILFESKDQEINYKKKLIWVQDKELTLKLENDKKVIGKYTGTMKEKDQSQAFGIGRFISDDGLVVIESQFRESKINGYYRIYLESSYTIGYCNDGKPTNAKEYNQRDSLLNFCTDGEWAF